MKTFIITILNTVNMSRDIDLDYPEIKAHNYIVSAENEKQAYQIAKEQNFAETGKGVWEQDIELL